MSRRNRHWNSLNEVRSYPLDEQATGLSDDGVPLRPNVLVDLQLRYPRRLGRYPFLSSVSVTPNLVTLTFQAADDLDSPGFTPLGVVAIPQPVEEDRQYAIEAHTAGVGGWVVLGSGVRDEMHSWRLRTPRQGLLVPRAARGYRDPPVSNIGLLYEEKALTGLVSLTAAPPVEIVRASREIDGVERDVAVFRLVQDDLNTGNVFEQFVGPCGQRPESGNCGTPEPIEFIAGVSPDCDGVLTLSFSGCARVAELQGTCGLVLDCGLGLAEACAQADQTTYPWQDQCETASTTSSPSSESGSEPTDESPGSESSIDGELPYLDCFDDGTAHHFHTEEGAFNFVEDDPPSEMCQADESSSSTSSLGIGWRSSYATEDVSSGVGRNVSVWEGFDDTPLDRQIMTDMKLTLGPSGAKHNGGIVLNYRDHDTIPGGHVYFLASLDFDLQQLQLLRFSGISFSTIASVAVPVALDEWYRLTATAQTSGGQVAITVALRGIDTPATTASIGPVLTSSYLPATGHNGLGSFRGFARWGFIRIAEA